MRKLLFMTAIAAIMCSCNSEDQAKQRSINDMSKGLVEFSKINDILSGASKNGNVSIYVDSIAKTITRKLSYEEKLLKIHEMMFTIANETAYPWVNSSVEKYMASDSTNVTMADSDERNANRFRLAIAQNLIDAQTTINMCKDENPVNLHDLTDLSFEALNSFNTFFFCYYFITDNMQYLQFFSSNSEKVNNLKNYADTIMSCKEIQSDLAFKMASTLEATAFTITMSTLSFNTLWNNHSEKMEAIADFFNKYSEMTISAFSETSDKSKIEIFNDNEYTEYLKTATKYKTELMDMVVTELIKTEQE